MDHLGRWSTPGVEFLSSLVDQMREFGLALDPGVGGALRALATLQATLEGLAPGFNLVEEAKAYGRETLSPFGLGGRDEGRENLESVVSNLVPILTTHPGRLDGIVESIERGELSLVLRHLGTDRERQFVTHFERREGPRPDGERHTPTCTPGWASPTLPDWRHS